MDEDDKIIEDLKARIQKTLVKLDEKNQKEEDVMAQIQQTLDKTEEKKKKGKSYEQLKQEAEIAKSI